MATQQEYYQQLAASRAQSKNNIAASVSAQTKSNAQQAASDPNSQLSMARRSGAKKNSAKTGDLLDSTKSLPLAFTAVEFGKDGIHFLVIMVSLIADLLTLIPVAGNFFGLFFSLVIWVLYAFGGHLNKKVGRKVVVTSISQGAEVFGFVVNAFPFFTASAIINYWFALADRRAEQVRMKKATA